MARASESNSSKMTANDVAARQYSQQCPLWLFSTRFYHIPNVAAACLDLQDNANADVNVLLFLLWTALLKRQWSTDEITELEDKVRPWRERVVLPLRTLRRVLKGSPAVGLVDKPGAEHIREGIKRVELEAEQLQQEAMYASLSWLPITLATSPDEAVRANLVAYETVCGTKFPERSIEVLHDAFNVRHLHWGSEELGQLSSP